MISSFSYKNNKALYLTLFALVLGAVFYFYPVTSFAKDWAANAKQDVTDTFGPGSTAWWIILLLEILSAAFIYIKTKNLAVFGGIIALILFGNVAFGLF